jgi:hypothetical protein
MDEGTISSITTSESIVEESVKQKEIGSTPLFYSISTDPKLLQSLPTITYSYVDLTLNHEFKQDNIVENVEEDEEDEMDDDEEDDEDDDEEEDDDEIGDLTPDAMEVAAMETSSGSGEEKEDGEDSESEWYDPNMTEQNQSKHNAMKHFCKFAIHFLFAYL